MPQTRIASAILIGALLACSEGGPTDPGTIQITASPSSLPVPQGGSGTVTVTLLRGGGFSATVTATVTGLPNGITASVVPAQLTGTTTSATVTVNVAASVAIGSYTATVRASAAGVGEATATYTVNVIAPPNFSLGVSPTSVTIPAGSSGAATVNITRTGGFAPSVALALTNPPGGITGTFNPTSAPAALSTLTVSVAGTVAPGTYALTITGTAAGVPNQTTTLTVVVTAAANFSLSVAPSPLTVQADGVAQATVSISRQSFGGTIDFSLDNPPGGITGTFNPASTTGLSTVVTIIVAGSVAPGNYNVTIRGTANDLPSIAEPFAFVGSRSTTLALMVTPTPTIALGVSPTPISIQQGGNGQSTVTISRTNFGNPVTLNATGQPANMGVTFNPQPATGTQSTATVTVAASVPTGSYPVTITGTASGVTNAQATLTVNVTQAPAGSPVEIQFCGAFNNPSFFAFQDGVGAWTRVTAVLENGVYKYRFNISQGRGSVYLVQQWPTSIVARPRARAFASLTRAHDMMRAARQRNGTASALAGAAFFYHTTVFSGSLAELQQTGADNCISTVDDIKQVQVQWGGVPTGVTASLGLGQSDLTFTSGMAANPIQFVDVRSGLIDLVGARLDASQNAERVLLIRNLNPPDGTILAGQNTANFDNSGISWPAATSSLSFTNRGTDPIAVKTSFWTANGERILLGTLTGPFNTNTIVTRGFPSPPVLPTDRHQHEVIAFASGSIFSDNLRFIFFFQNTLAAQTAAFSGAVSNVSFFETNPSRNLLAVTGDLPAETNQFRLMFVDDANEIIGWTVSASAGYFAAGAGGAARSSAISASLSMPDLTAMSGFPFASLLPSGSTSIVFGASGSNHSGPWQNIPPVGTIVQAAARILTVNVP